MIDDGQTKSERFDRPERAKKHEGKGEQKLACEIDSLGVAMNAHCTCMYNVSYI